jgi:hypothetical protein
MIASFWNVLSSKYAASIFDSQKLTYRFSNILQIMVTLQTGTLRILEE